MPADPLQFSTPVTPVDVLDKATEEGDLSEIVFHLSDPSNVHDQGIDKPPTCSMDNENPFHDLPNNYCLTQVEPPTGSMEDETPFHNLPDNHTLIPIEPPTTGNAEDENPFQQLSNTHPLTPTPDLHLWDNSSPSEPIALAFQHQGFGGALDMDPQSSPLGTFGEESSPQCPTLLSLTAIRDLPIDPTLLQFPLVGSTLPIVGSLADHFPMTTWTVNVVSAHPLMLFSTSRSTFLFDTFISGRLSKATPAAKNTPSPANMFDSEQATAAQPTPPATSPCRSLVATTIIASLSGLPLTATTAALSLTPATPPAPLLTPPLGIETRPPQKPINIMLPKEPSMQACGCSRGQGWGQGGGQGQGQGQGGGVAKENTTEDAANGNPNPDVHQVQLLSPASHCWIDILNKWVYTPDGTYHGPPLGASYSHNADGLHPCIMFKGPPPTTAPKKCSWDVVSKADIVSGKQAWKEHVRIN